MQHSHSALVRLHPALVEWSYAILNAAQQYQYFITIVVITVSYVTQLIVHRISHGQSLEATPTAIHTHNSSALTTICIGPIILSFYFLQT